MNRFCGLIIMDGFGLNEKEYGNAIKAEGTPFINSLLNQYPNSRLGACGMDVGLPDGQMGNSEVGHQNMGAGRIVYQELTRITKSIADGDFFQNESFLKAIENAKNNGKKLHIMGLLSNGGVHSHIDHLKALLLLAKNEGVKQAFVHCFMDGRDVPPKSGIDFIREIEAYMKEIGFGKIASVSGRYYAMDRDNRWERVSRAYKTLTEGASFQNEQGEDMCLTAKNAEEAVLSCYAKDITDEFIIPTAITRCSRPIGKIEQGDSVIFYNFRPDRAREITRAFTQKDFTGFDRTYLAPIYVCLTTYDATFENVMIAFKPQGRMMTLGEYFSQNGVRQLRIAETEKYAHVTFFFNGGVEQPCDMEERILVPSPKVATYDMQPEMSAYEVADKAVEAIKSGKFDAMILNFANCDMVGHTGVFEAAVKAVKAVDECVEKVISAIKEIGGMAIVTADHGNADVMLEEDGSVMTAHSLNEVPVIVVDDQNQYEIRKRGILADLAPTMLYMMGLSKPQDMTGESMVTKK